MTNSQINLSFYFYYAIIVGNQGCRHVKYYEFCIVSAPIVVGIGINLVGSVGMSIKSPIYHDHWLGGGYGGLGHSICTHPPPQSPAKPIPTCPTLQTHALYLKCTNYIHFIYFYLKLLQKIKNINFILLHIWFENFRFIINYKNSQRR